MRTFLLFSALIARLCLAQQPNEADWNLRLDKDGILVFTRPMPDNPVDEFLALTLINGDIDSAFAIISAPVRFLSTDPYVRHPELLNQVDSHDFYLRNEVKMPFFLKKRDMVTRIRTSKTSRGYMMVGECYPDFIPVRPGFVRVQQGNIIVGLRQTGPGQFELMYRGYVYPTMPITTHYVNKMIVPSTFDRIDGVRRLLQQPL